MAKQFSVVTDYKDKVGGKELTVRVNKSNLKTVDGGVTCNT